jgi:hypothetical protein
VLQRLFQQAPAAVYQHVECVEEQRLRFGAVMLEQIEGDPPAFIASDDFAVYKRAGREFFAGTSDVRELLCE